MDRYRRALAICRLGSEDLNTWMVREGFALAFVKYSTAYVGEESAARKPQRGLWSSAFIAPWEWRHRDKGTVGGFGRPFLFTHACYSLTHALIMRALLPELVGVPVTYDHLNLRCRRLVCRSRHRRGALLPHNRSRWSRAELCLAATRSYVSATLSFGGFSGRRAMCALEKEMSAGSPAAPDLFLAFAKGALSPR
jgi:hypothetical protein